MRREWHETEIFKRLQPGLDHKNIFMRTKTGSKKSREQKWVAAMSILNEGPTLSLFKGHGDHLRQLYCGSHMKHFLKNNKFWSGNPAWRCQQQIFWSEFSKNAVAGNTCEGWEYNKIKIKEINFVCRANRLLLVKCYDNKKV